jgi:hypothetical protein
VRQISENVRAANEEVAMTEQRFPTGWGEDRAKRLIAHYESLPEDEQVAEDEAAWEGEGTTWIAVPDEPSR